MPSLPVLLRRSVAFLSLGAALAFAAACASAPKGAAAGEQQGSAPSSRDVLAASQLEESAAPNLYDAIRQLRPELLTGRRLGVPDVYVDNVRQLAGLERLKQIAVVSVAEVRYLSATAARSLPGAQSEAGALVITLK